MQLNNIKEVQVFMDLVENCSGQVLLKSPQGDVFNLKSSFSKYIAVGKLIEESSSELELFCTNPEDEARFLQFFKDNPGTL